MARSNPHWDSFVANVPWILRDDERAIAGDLAEPGAWRTSNATRTLLPGMTELLERACTSPVTIGARAYVLFSWEGEDGVSAWLSPRPTSTPSHDLLPAHRELLLTFGGIVERSNEPEGTWLLNTNESLTDAEARHDATFIEEYSWAFEDVPGGIPIELGAYSSISREANGNTTLCHRTNGDVVLFAPDHSFDDVEPLPGCPEYTLYRRRGGETFVAWVETVAAQWQEGLGW